MDTKCIVHAYASCTVKLRPHIRRWPFSGRGSHIYEDATSYSVVLQRYELAALQSKQGLDMPCV